MNKTLKKSAISALLLMALLCLMTACSNVGATTSSASTVPIITVPSKSAPHGKPTVTSVTTTTSNTTNTAKATVPLLAIRMLDETHGWALTKNQILRTTTGGTTWQDVTPPKANLNVFSKGDFYNNQYAWIVSPPLDPNTNQVVIWYTANGGQSWGHTIISTFYTSGADYPHFLSTTNGWLLLLGSPGAGQRPSAVYHTTDGGRSWAQVLVQKSQQYSVIRANGLSFKDAQNGWITGDASASQGASSLPPLTVTHDGGATWQAQALPSLPAIGASDGGLATSTPPVFFGNNAVMPVERENASQVNIVLYTSADGGKSWSVSTPLIVPTTTPPSVYVVDPQHAWATIGDSVYATANAGRTWSIVSHVASIGNISFVNDTTGWAIGNPASQTSNQIILDKTTDGGVTWQKINYTIN